MENEKQIVPAGQQAVEQKFDGSIMQQRAEMAAVQVAKEAEAQVNARFIMAMRNPRNEDNASVKIINTCKNVIFAEKAMYAKPVGGNKIEGLSIRFAEEMARNWKNIYINTAIVYEDEQKRIVRVMVLDLESNLNYDKTIILEKTIERKNAKGREVVSERLNSYGEKVSIVKATEDEMMVKENALASKAIRNGILRCIPTHILEQAKDSIKQTIRSGISTDPAEAKRKVASSFGKLNIMPDEIEKYLGHSLDTMSKDEISELKIIHASIVDGETSWNEVVNSEAIDVPAKESAEVDAEEMTEWEKEDQIQASEEKGSDVKESVKEQQKKK